MNKIIVVILMLALHSVGWAQTHKGVSFQAIIKSPDGTYPTIAGLTVNAKVLSPNNCVLWEEEHTGVNISAGYLNLVVGRGTTIGYQPAGQTFTKVFNNSSTQNSLTCLNADGSVNGGTTSYAPASQDGRKLRVDLTLSGNPVVADFNLRSMPFAVNAENLNGKSDTDFIQGNTPMGVTQSSVEQWFSSTVMQNLLAGTYNAPSATSALNVSGIVGIANGGTGAANVAAARTNLGLGPLATMNPTGTADNTTYLRGDGSWQTVTGGVSSVAGKTGAVTLQASDITDFDTAADARITAQKGVASGLATLNGAGKVPSTQLALTGADIPNLDASKITSGILTQNVSANSLAGTTGSFTNLRIYDGTSEYLTMTLPAGGTGYALKWPNAVGSVGNVLQTDASGNLSWVAIPSAPVTSVAGRTGAVTLSNTDISGLGTSATLNVAASGNAAATEVVKGNDTRLTGAFQSSTALGGDLSGTLPNPTVAKIQGRAMDATAPLDGQAVLWDNGNTTWKAQYVRMQDIRNAWGGTQMIPSSACAANESMVWSVITDRFTCQGIGSLNASAITAGTIDVARLPSSATYWQAATGGINYAGGNVGIGTTSPESPLHIGSTGPITFVNNDPSIGYNAYYNSGWKNGTGSKYSGIQSFDPSNGNWYIQNTSTTSAANASIGLSTRFLVDKDGNVGIGTTAPATTLDVNGSQVLRGDGSGYGLFIPKFSTSPFGANYDRFQIKVDPSSQVTTLGNANGGTGSARSLAILTASVERMRIDTSGNVGIGTPAPAYKLDVNGAINATSVLINGTPVGAGGTQWANGGGGAISYSGGNVGVGTAAPGYAFDVNQKDAGSMTAKFGDARPIYLRQDNPIIGFNTYYDGTNWRYGAGSVANYASIIVGDATNGGMSFQVSSATGAAGAPAVFPSAMVLDKNGSVGIGTTSPVAKLHVVPSGSDGFYASAGFLAATSARIGSISSGGSGNVPLEIMAAPVQFVSGGTGFETMRITSNGLVGIGVTNPTERLEVSGRVKATELCIGVDCRNTWPSGGGGGSVTSVNSANADISVANTTTTPVLTLNSGTGANQIVKLNGSSELPSVSGVNLTNLNASNLSSGTLPAARLPALTGDVTSTAGSSSTTIANNAVTSAKIVDGSVGVVDLDFAGAMAINTGVVVRNGSQFYNKTCSGNEILIWSVANGWICNAVVLTESDPKVGSNTTNYLSKWNGSALVTSGVYESGGNVGIGTTAPNSKLEIGTPPTNNYFYGTAAIFNATADSTTGPAIAINRGGVSNSQNLLLGVNQASTYSEIQAAQSNVGYNSLVLNRQGGNVGIGTTNPSGNLEVASEGSGQTNIFSTSASSGVPGSGNFIGTRTRGTLASRTQLNSGDRIAAFLGTNGTTNNSWAGMSVFATETHTSSAQGKSLNFQTTSNGGISDNIRMTIDHNGNVGIGTSSPAKNLHIVGFAGAGSPVAAVETLGSVYSDRPGYLLKTPSYNGYLNLDPTNGSFNFGTASTDRLTISATGNVGIGTTNPSGIFHVAGGTAASGDGSTITLAAQNAAPGNNNGGNIFLQPGKNTGSGYAGGVYVNQSDLNSVLSVVNWNSTAARYPSMNVINYRGSPDAGGVPQVVLANYRGISGAANAAQSGDTLGQIMGSSVDGTNSGTAFHNGSAISFYAAGNWNASSAPGAIAFATTPVNSLFASERMRIDQNGNVGIGTTNPSGSLDILNSGSSAQVITQSPYGSLRLFGGWTDSWSYIEAGNQNFSGNNNGLILSGYAANNLPALKVLATNSLFFGNVGIGGVTNPAYTLDVNGSARATGSVAAWSDIRVKKNIATIDNGLEKILRLKGVSFDWRNDEFPDKKFKEGRDIGVIAQNVETQFPEIVETGKDGYKSVAYQKLVACCYPATMA